MGKHRIVVGVEGSGYAKAALVWALKEARYRDASVEVVTAYSPTYVPAAPDLGYVPVDAFDLVAEVERMQGDVIDAATSVVDATGIEVERTLVKGRPVDSLISVSEGAAMLVVGNRGRGGFRGLMLGSVSHQLAHHAKCPLVIVRTDLETTD